VQLSQYWSDVCGGFAAERYAGRKYRSVAAGAGAAYQLQMRLAANAGSVTLRAEERGGSTAQRRLVSQKQRRIEIKSDMILSTS